MNEFIYDLIEKLEQDDVRGILAREEAPEYYYALSGDRQNVAEWLPLGKEMDVLFIGANYGAFCELAEKVRSLDIFDPTENGLTVVRKRFGEKLSGLGDIGLHKSEPKKLYDMVIIPVITARPAPIAIKPLLISILNSSCQFSFLISSGISFPTSTTVSVTNTRVWIKPENKSK